jgi:hypothetical protein
MSLSDLQKEKLEQKNKIHMILKDADRELLILIEKEICLLLNKKYRCVRK